MIPQFTNNTESSTREVKLIDLKMTKNYGALTKFSSKDSLTLDNLTVPTGSPREILEIGSKRIAKVSHSDALDVTYPRVVSNPVQGTADLQWVVHTEDTKDSNCCGQPVVDDPTVLRLIWRRTTAGTVTDEILGQMLQRLVSALQKEDGTWRFSEIDRGIFQPHLD